MHLVEIEDLKRALQSQNNRVQQFEEEKEKIVAEKNDTMKTIITLEADLKRVKRDAETFGRDLKALRAEKEKAETKYRNEIAKLERTKKQTQTRLRLANEELSWQKEQVARTKENLDKHICTA